MGGKPLEKQDHGKPLVLASGSPRRIELISLLGIPFEVAPSQAEEKATGSGAERVMALARLKCDDVFARMPDRFVLAADTLVCIDGAVLGKPRDETDAIRMLRALSGRAHEVHTGVCLRGPNGALEWEAATTTVIFRALTDDEIKRYAQSGEPLDKAGAYAIQGRASAFVERIEGSPTNVVGLPMALVCRMLCRHGLTAAGIEQNHDASMGTDV